MVVVVVAVVVVVVHVVLIMVVLLWLGATSGAYHQAPQHPDLDASVEANLTSPFANTMAVITQMCSCMTIRTQVLEKRGSEKQQQQQQQKVMRAKPGSKYRLFIMTLCKLPTLAR